MIASIVLCIAFPFFARFADRKGLFPAWLSSIIACYLVGILVSNLRLWEVDNELMESVAGASMLIGLPLLLFAVRIRESLKYAGQMLFGFVLCCLAGLLCTGVVGYLMSGQIEDSWKIAGMLVGLYTGGTPNVQAIGLALDAPSEYLVLVQAADVLLGGSYLLGLVTFLPAVFARFYRASETTSHETPTEEEDQIGLPRQLVQLGTALGVTAASVGVTYLLTGGMKDLTVLILVLTTLSLVVATSPLSDRIGNSYPLGEYFILVFCVALGLMADFRALAADGMDLLYFSALALVSTTLLHLLLCKLFDVDRDTMILSYVAGFYGPVFVVQVAAALRNKRLLAAGIAVSLFGFGIGNYLGIGLAYLIDYLTALS
ncbi:DUF819 family protein [Neolewinella aurantiaca]|uniref:DUF819 family protein n=1 Tax=Neolewinella aurantiaca TaxID=2602767 RepID=A0A5C7FG45_9BACT|nr:DUF819 family protein [Neolewinella aurantiaca]TXF88579.1 DUF819 family protein [Neolewinella aurantiaca]